MGRRARRKQREVLPFGRRLGRPPSLCGCHTGGQEANADTAVAVWEGLRCWRREKSARQAEEVRRRGGSRRQEETGARHFHEAFAFPLFVRFLLPRRSPFRGGKVAAAVPQADVRWSAPCEPQRRSEWVEEENIADPCVSGAKGSLSLCRSALSLPRTRQLRRSSATAAVNATSPKGARHWSGARARGVRDRLHDCEKGTTPPSPFSRACGLACMQACTRGGSRRRRLACRKPRGLL